MGIQLFAIHSEAGSTAHQPLLLVIEDDALLRESLVEILKLSGFRTVEAQDGHNGIAMSHTYQPDCILLDLRLPDIDGFAVLRRMKKHELTAQIPVIVLSGFSRSEDQELALELGAIAYFIKPYDTQDLVATIHKVLE